MKALNEMSAPVDFAPGDKAAPGDKLGWLDSYFKISERGSTIATEIRGGITTFLTMAYILFINPQILAKAGMPAYDVAIATALASGIATLIMGFYARFPFALAPGMGLNAFFTYGVVLGMGVSWQVALTAVFVEGLLFLLLAQSGVRRMLIEAIPYPIKIATTVGIGLFLSIIALENVKLVVDHPATLVTLGSLKQPSVIMCLAGVLLTGWLLVRKVKGAMLIGIMAITALAWLLGFAPAPKAFLAWPSLPADTLAALDFSQILSATFITVVLAFLFVDLFDTAGTLMGVGRLAGFLDKQGRLPGADRAFTADAVGTTFGGLTGTSALVCYIESATGVEEGARTGLAAVVIGFLFLAALFFTPLFVAVPAMATAPALLIVGALMLAGAAEIEWGKLEDAIPAFLTIVMMPLTYSVAHGISIGLVSHTVLRLLLGRPKDVHPIAAGFSLLLVIYYATLGQH